MNMEIISRYDEVIQDAIVSYVNLVKADFIPDFFKDEDEILWLIANNLREVFYNKFLRETGSSYSFEGKILRLGSDYTKSIIIHELHHLIQSSYAARKLVENGANYSPEVIAQKVNILYTKYADFFEGMAYYWETRYCKNENEASVEADSFYENPLMAINKLAQMWGFKEVIRIDLCGILGLSYLLRYNQACFFEQIFNILKAISNVNKRIDVMEYEKQAHYSEEYYTPAYNRNYKYEDIDGILTKLQLEKQKLIEAVNLLLDIDGLE